MATKAKIAERVLQKLTVLEHGETMDTGDQAIVEEAYDSSLAILDSLNLVSWGSSDDIPTQAELPIIDYVADKVKGAFQIPQDVRQSLPFEAQQAENTLAFLVTPDYIPDTTQADYY